MDEEENQPAPTSNRSNAHFIAGLCPSSGYLEQNSSVNVTKAFGIIGDISKGPGQQTKMLKDLVINRSYLSMLYLADLSLYVLNEDKTLDTRLFNYKRG